jgi:hypothetical protein
MSDTPETDAAYTCGAGDLRILAQRLERERDEAREAAAKWESSSDAMERAGAEQARRADENREWALRAERERDEARTVLERIVKLSINARRVEEDYAEWEKAVLAILDICEERKEK